MKEHIEDRRLTGTIKVKLEKGGYWMADKMDVCRSIVAIIDEYSDAGYTLTLRQLYYQLVAKDLIPNDDKVYKKLSGILDDLRYSGSVDWDAIEDRGRVPYLPYYVSDLDQAVQDTIDQYRLDRQEGQDTVVEVWTEKDAISGILRRITSYFHIQLVVNKGYSSSTAMHDAYLRFVRYINEGKKVLVLYFGDHDPSGLDMVRDIDDRIKKFLCCGSKLDREILNDWWDDNGPEWYYVLSDEDYEDLCIYDDLTDYKRERLGTILYEAKAKRWVEDEQLFTIRHIGLTMDQINEFNPPPNPAKIKDPRAKWYIEQHGPISWEVDALSPQVMSRIVTDAIEEEIDLDLFNEMIEREDADKAKLSELTKK